MKPPHLTPPPPEMTPARARLLALWQEQAITLTLLEMPDFRRKAGLPPRAGGSTLEEMARALGVTRERVRSVEQTALKKLRRYIDPAYIHEIQRAGY